MLLITPAGVCMVSLASTVKLLLIFAHQQVPAIKDAAHPLLEYVLALIVISAVEANIHANTFKRFVDMVVIDKCSIK